MNSKVVKRIGLGVLLYISFVVVLVIYNPDDTSKMGWEDRQEFNTVQIAKLEMGTPRDAILELMGPPDISEAKKMDDGYVQVLFYRTQHKQSDGITTQDECTPLLFEDNTLVAWGDGTYQAYLNR
ncbi:DUF3192 domain-containing protein [Aliiglaciecola sp. LCG003]|uniref:DUF3192 domain-containing protein n=1 Tax=Aliiglaciecola sp. LCG003 TaxID=3053655 RepID=UPI002572EEB4|nr:DUF3192 domain-containing protein [Aliiglaciecola sp. LCG003]WJG10416.1 DUF3192 domain-containing protein [Aliiglaciecola sp. LCG003]